MKRKSRHDGVLASPPRPVGAVQVCADPRVLSQLTDRLEVDLRPKKLYERGPVLTYARKADSEQPGVKDRTGCADLSSSSSGYNDAFSADVSRESDEPALAYITLPGQCPIVPGCNSVSLHHFDSLVASPLDSEQ